MGQALNLLLEMRGREAITGAKEKKEKMLFMSPKMHCAAPGDRLAGRRLGSRQGRDRPPLSTRAETSAAGRENLSPNLVFEAKTSVLFEFPRPRSPGCPP